MAVNGQFGLLYSSTMTGFAPVSIPLTLQLIFSTAAVDPVTVTGTVRGSVGPGVGLYPHGAVILTFDDKRIVGGRILKINFVDPTTSLPRRMELTLRSVPG